MSVLFVKYILTVYHIGLSKSDLAVLNAASRILELRNIKLNLINKPSNQCHIILLDVDNKQGQHIYQQLMNRQFSQQLWVLSQNKIATRNTAHFISKPLRVQYLFEYFELFCNNNKKSTAVTTDENSQPDLIKIQKKPKPLAKKKIKPSNSSPHHVLLDIIWFAQQKELVLRVDNPAALSFVVDGKKNIVLYAGTEQALFDSFKQHSTLEYIYEEIGFEKLNQLDTQLTQIKLDDALWYASLADQRGILGNSLQDNVPVKLRAWPNMTRIGREPNYIKMAAILTRRPISLTDLLTQHELSRNEAVCFYNAVHSNHLLIIAKSNIQPKPPKPQKNHHGLLKKIANHLHIKL